MKLVLSMAAILGVLVSSVSLVRDAQASGLTKFCGDYSFLGGAKEYVGWLSNRRRAGLVLFDARSESGRVLILYFVGKKPDGSKRQSCSPVFGQLKGNTLEVRFSRRTRVSYTFEESGEVSLTWVRTNRKGKVHRLTGKLR